VKKLAPPALPEIGKPPRHWPLPERVGHEEALAAATDGAQFLYRAGAHRVWLFGSIAKGRKLGVHSDFDFATEGLPPAKYLHCLGSLLMTMPLPVDLVELESASAMFRQRILDEGVVLPHADQPD
jgi:predicted nucleotidyltransferase